MMGKKNFFRRGYIDLRMHEEATGSTEDSFEGTCRNLKPRGKRTPLILFVASHLSSRRAKGWRRVPTRRAIIRSPLGLAGNPVGNSVRPREVLHGDHQLVQPDRFSAPRSDWRRPPPQRRLPRCVASSSPAGCKKKNWIQEASAWLDYVGTGGGVVRSHRESVRRSVRRT